MAGYLEPAQLYYMATNAVIALGFASVALATFIALVGKKAHYRWLSILLGILFAVLCVSRTFKAIDFHHIPSPPELVADMVAAILCMILGVMIWPILSRALSLPSYDEIKTINEDLEYWEKLFETFMEHSPAVAFLLDSEYKFLYCNKSFEKNFGVTRQEIIGKDRFSWTSEETAKQIHALNERVIAEGEPITEVIWSRTQSNAEPDPWLTIRFPVMSNHHNATIGGFAINVSATHKIEVLHAKLAAIVESSQDAIIGKDLEGTITSWNNGAEELYGYTAREAIGQNITMLVPAERQDEVPMLLDKLRRGIRLNHYETTRVCKNGETKDVSLSLSPIRSDGSVIGAAVIARDITAQKRQEQEIKHLNKQLKDRVYELAEQTAALQAARDQALEASNLKSAFCANISHELRTPLSGIMGLNEMLLQNGNLQGEDLQLTNMIQESSKALLTVVNDILDLSKIEAGKITLEYEPFNPVLLVRDCTRLMAPTAHQKKLNYEAVIDQEMPDVVYGDVSRLRQVLLNLIGNAIKFTEKGSVQVRADLQDIKDDRAVLAFSVKDTGIGIAREDQRFLFMPFQQLDNSSTRKFGGTGLGLAISQRFVEMMDSKIVLQSEKGRGSTFSFCVRFDREKLHAAQDFSTEKMTKPGVEPIPAELAVGRRVLVVEDSAVLQHLALRQLASLGIEAQATVFGREAVEMAMTDRFDLILMDINLPDINGLEATVAIRSLEQGAGRPSIPIIAMTAGAMQGDRERAMASGMDDYLSKPVAIENLKQTIELWLRKKSHIKRNNRPPAGIEAGATFLPVQLW